MLLKNMFLVLVCLLSLSAMGQVTSGADIIVLPSWPSSCKVAEYKRNLNVVYDIEKVEENDDQATFQLKTQYVLCNNGSLIPYPLMAPMVDIDKHGILPSFGKRGVSATWQVLNNNELEVTFVFDKKNIFKRKSKTEQHFDMIFLPNGVSLYNQMMFWWDVWLIRDVSSNSIQLRLSKKA